MIVKFSDSSSQASPTILNISLSVCLLESLLSDLQVEILQLENSLSQARQRLGEMRKISYQED